MSQDYLPKSSAIWVYRTLEKGTNASLPLHILPFNFSPSTFISLSHYFLSPFSRFLSFSLHFSLAFLLLFIPFSSFFISFFRLFTPVLSLLSHYSLPILSLFSAYSLPVLCRFSPYSLPSISLFFPRSLSFTRNSCFPELRIFQPSGNQKTPRPVRTDELRISSTLSIHTLCTVVVGKTM